MKYSSFLTGSLVALLATLSLGTTIANALATKNIADRYTRCSNPRSDYPYCYRQGDRGDNVGQLIAMLQRFGYYSGRNDQIFGRTVHAAVQRFQTQHGLRADGIVGRSTMWAMCNKNAQQYGIANPPICPSGED